MQAWILFAADWGESNHWIHRAPCNRLLRLLQAYSVFKALLAKPLKVGGRLLPAQQLTCCAEPDHGGCKQQAW
jgi:hypothetical protein